MGEVIAANTDISVVEECEDWLVVDKPAPLIIHPTSKKVEPSLLGEVNRHLEERGEVPGTLSIINRLDRETSGLVLMARNPPAARAFGKAMMRREIEKRYLAIVRGWPEWDETLVDAPLIRRGEVEFSQVWVMQKVHPEGKPCRTRFFVERRFERAEGRFALLRVVTETGRMHQIRAHCAYAGHPMVGDKIYGGDERCYLKFIGNGWTEDLRERLLLPRQALHASFLALPVGDERREWSAPLPPELGEFLVGGEDESS
jgi:23S rRNA pseudouridine1911/1915/1917 synthase